MITIGAKILLAREARKLSQNQLAERMQVTRQAVSRWETGQTTPSLELLPALSECLGVSLEYLLDMESEEAWAEMSLADFIAEYGDKIKISVRKNSRRIA